MGIQMQCERRWRFMNEHNYSAVDDSDAQLLADPLLQAVYDDLDDEDKGVIKDIGEAKQRK